MNIIKYTKTIENLLKEIKYNEDDGNFYWVNPKQGRPKDRPAGSTNHQGYTQIKYNGQLFTTSRLVWYIKTGEIPKEQIGYKDGNPRNTRWDNLKLVTHLDRTKAYRESVKEKKDKQQLEFIGQTQHRVKRATFTKEEVHQAVEDFIKDKKLIDGVYK